MKTLMQVLYAQPSALNAGSRSSFLFVSRASTRRRRRPSSRIRTSVRCARTCWPRRTLYPGGSCPRAWRTAASVGLPMRARGRITKDCFCRCRDAPTAVPSYVYHDLGALISSLLCLNARHVGKMNRHGALKMARNLFALQNCLSEALAPVAMLEPQLDRARQLYAVLNCDMEVRAIRKRNRGCCGTGTYTTKARSWLAPR